MVKVENILYEYCKPGDVCIMCGMIAEVIFIQTKEPLCINCMLNNNEAILKK